MCVRVCVRASCSAGEHVNQANSTVGIAAAATEEDDIREEVSIMVSLTYVARCETHVIAISICNTLCPSILAAARTCRKAILIYIRIFIE